MSAAAQWHARIDCGTQVGAGFLVSERHVLTCAHVVRDGGPAEVAFPQSRRADTFTATVVAHGGWAGGDDDPGDVAVLELDRTPGLAPARFAALGEGVGDPLVVSGFPEGYGKGALAAYRCVAEELIADEWAQLEAVNGHGQPIEAGFSGAAAALADTGRVVGMVTSADGRAGVRTSQMLPAAVIARYWPPLADRIPTPGVAAPERERLRLLVQQAQDAGVGCGPDHLYARSVGPMDPQLPPGGFRSPWEAAWYLVTEVDQPAARLRQFTAALADHVEDRVLRAALLRWGGPAPVAAAPAPAARGWSPILVDIARSGEDPNTALVEVSAYSGGGRRVMGARTLRRGAALRTYVLDRIDDAFRELPPDAQELIAFVLPSAWISDPVDEWQRSKDDRSPLGCFSPVVVMDRDRRVSGALQHRLARKWHELEKAPPSRLHRIECGSAAHPDRLTVRLRGEAVVALAGPPKSRIQRKLYKAGLHAPVPAMLWPRTSCTGPHPGPHAAGCSGTAFLDTLAEHLAGLPLGELPQHILHLRESAYGREEGERHWAEGVTLLWEDPRCFPDTPGHLCSPVG